MSGPLRRWVVLSSIAGCFLLLFVLYQDTALHRALSPTDTSSSTLPSLPLSNPPPPDTAQREPTSPSNVPSNTRHSPASDLQRFQWNKVKQYYPVTSLIPLPSAPPEKVPSIQYQFVVEPAAVRAIREQRLQQVREAFVHTWNGYKEHAWLKDELAPISGSYTNTLGGWAATLVDSLDTLWIMDFKDEFEEAVGALQQLDFSSADGDELNIFETTIRYLGGFLGAYDVSNGQYPALLDKAVELADMLYVAFDTPNRMPITRWHWKSAASGERQEPQGQTLVSEIGSLTLEFTRLSQLTGNPKYYDAVQRISDVFDKTQSHTKLPGMWPIIVDGAKQDFVTDSAFTLGGMSDSLYEYFPKEHLLLSGRTQQYRKLYEESITTIKRHALFRPMTTDSRDILLSGDIRVTDDEQVILEPKGQHLACFAGGMIGIGSKVFDRPEELSIARKLVDGCLWAYESMPTGIMPEVFHAIPCSNSTACGWDEMQWYTAILSRQGNPENRPSESMEERAHYHIREKRLQPGFSDVGDRRYILRPELIESVFILYRITGDVILQDKAWRMFQAINKHARTDIAYAEIQDVTQDPPPKQDRMESFWTAETLKYFYLIFSSPNIIGLDEYVL